MLLDRFLSGALALLLICSAMLVNAQNCATLADPTDSSKIYNLNPLAAATDYVTINTRYPTYSFNINVCKPLVYTDSVCAAGTGICEKSSFSSSKIGMSATTFTVQSPGVLVMTYSGGTGCFSGTITFTCKEGAGIGAPVYVSENCIYAFSWETEYACSKALGDGDDGDDDSGPPGTGGLSIGSILCIIFFVSIFVYFAAGYAFRYQKYEARGVDAIPNLDFWRELPALVKDGSLYSYHKIRGTSN